MKRYLIVVSAALNVAFIGMWMTQATARHTRSADAGEKVAHTVWCPLHRQLKVTEEQWVQIEPPLREFQAAVEALREQTGELRSKVIALIATEDPDVEMIHTMQDQILETKRQIQHLVLDHLLAEKKILTTAQQQHLFDMLRNRTQHADGPPMTAQSQGGLAPVLQNPNGPMK
ncbi:Spy/CpxP family protein refolding chaperone [Novipirellula aureliae]|uniref:Spy/CpxP family protein refolding chaperone n=1 Tax=Novipirellula aureliae TaxID=2527966 RepID=UPI0011B72755|nr:periplasmic heavy metal sensor [Novipirellula aureliae]